MFAAAIRYKSNLKHRTRQITKLLIGRELDILEYISQIIIESVKIYDRLAQSNHFISRHCYNMA